MQVSQEQGIPKPHATLSRPALGLWGPSMVIPGPGWPPGLLSPLAGVHLLGQALSSFGKLSCPSSPQDLPSLPASAQTLVPSVCPAPTF